MSERKNWKAEAEMWKDRYVRSQRELYELKAALAVLLRAVEAEDD